MRKTTVREINPRILMRAAEIIKLLGHPQRLKIVEVLEQGEATVGDIQSTLDLPQATVSQHLARLRGLGIVESQRDGNHVIYRLIEPKVPRILQCIRDCDA